MQSTNQPGKFLSPFAQQDGARAEVPLTTSDATRASQSAGFPPLTGQPPEAGGVPPQLPDMNGLLNMGSRGVWWSFLGGRWGYDSAFATNAAINGYPRGALLASADLTGEWLSVADNNTVNPDTVGTGWVPGTFYGQTLLAGQTGGTVTLTPAQAAKPVLRITGTLAGNLIVELPAWIRDWTIYNGTSGAFTVSVRTPGRPSVVVPQTGAPIAVRGDGTDVTVTSVDVPQASTTVAGITRYATTPEAVAGSSQTVALTPFGLTQAVPGMVPVATSTVQGKTRLTNAGEGVANDGTIALTPQAAAAAYARINGPFANPLGTAILAGAASVSIRPNGVDSEAGRVFVSSTGEVVAAGVIRSEASIFYGGSTVRLATTGSGGSVSLRPNGGNSTVGEFYVLNSGNVFAAGSMSAAGGYDTGSSRTVKDIEASFPYGLNEVLSIAPIHFRYTKAYRDDDRLVLGFPAEDVREVLPEVVRETPDAPSPLALQAEQLVPVLWRAVQELAARVEELEAR